MDFSDILKELREAHNLTQEELAAQLDLSRSTIAGYESQNRQPDFDKLITISRYFHVPIDFLITGERTPLYSSVPLPESSEKLLDRKVIKAYRRLGIEEKQDALKYIELLELKQKTQNP